VSNNSWNQTLVTLQAAGPTISTGGTTQSSLLNGQAQFTFPANLLKIGDAFKIAAKGIISCAATTPGASEFLIVDTTQGVTLFNSGALNLNTAGKTNVPWSLDIDLVCRSIGSGTSATFWGQGTFSSEAIVGAAVNTAGGNGLLNIPVGSLAASAGFNSSTSFVIDLQFLQSVTTGSITCEQYRLDYLT
jgi:hypothetical protein